MYRQRLMTFFIINITNDTIQLLTNACVYIVHDDIDILGPKLAILALFLVCLGGHLC